MASVEKTIKQKVKLISNDEALGIRRSDLDRLKRMVDEIKKPSQMISGWYFFLLGIFVASLFSIFTLPANASSWVKPSFIAIAISSLFLSIILFFVERILIKRVKDDSSNILTEIGKIEELY